MPKMLNDGAVEYEDGTSATEAQVCLPLKISTLSNKKLVAVKCSLSNVFLRIKLTLLSCWDADGERCCVILVMGCRT